MRNEHVARYEFAAAYVQNKVIVDCACGTGEGTSHFLRAGAERIHAFDVSEPAIADASVRWKSAKVEFRLADALKLPLDAESADVFVSLETVEHIPDDVEFIKEISRILKPGGLLICSTPNRTLTNPGLRLNEQPFNPFHIREYSAAEFQSLLGAQFSEVTLFGQNPRTKRYANALTKIGKLTPFRGAARINQILKLSRLIYYNHAYAAVAATNLRREYEYAVAVCRKQAIEP